MTKENSKDVLLLIEKHKSEFKKPKKIIISQAATTLLERNLYIVEAPVAEFIKLPLYSKLCIEGAILTKNGEQGIHKEFQFSNSGINFEILQESNQFIFSEGGLQIVICK